MTFHDTRSREIATLNDLARKTFQGCRVILTSGVFNLPDAAQFEILQRVRTFDAFTPDNDPYGEHDFGAFDFWGDRLYWKFDYHDKSSMYHSPDASDPEQTLRVLTIMLADEY